VEGREYEAGFLGSSGTSTRSWVGPLEESTEGLLQPSKPWNMVGHLSKLVDRPTKGPSGSQERRKR
jgi:hypothetical protein